MEECLKNLKGDKLELAALAVGEEIKENWKDSWGMGS